MSFTSLNYHVIFSTKYRKPVIDESIRERLYEYIGGIIRAKEGTLIEIGGVADHIHILAGCSPQMAVADWVRDIKANSARWMNELPDRSSRFEWQKGYGAFLYHERRWQRHRHGVEPGLRDNQAIQW